MKKQSPLKKRFQDLFVFLIVPASFSFFGANFLNSSFNNYVNFFFCFIAFALGVRFAFKQSDEFDRPVQLIGLSILFSVVMAFLSWGQDFKSGIIATVPSLLWVFFFYLKEIKFPVKTLEKVVVFYAFVYLALYLFQFINPDTVLFGVAGRKGFSSDRGITRIIFPGGGVFYLAVFIAINKLTELKDRRRLWIFFTVLGIVIPVMQVTRQVIAAVLIIYLYHFLKSQNTKKKVIVIASVIAIIVIAGQTDIPVFKGLRKAQEQTAKEGTEDARVKAGLYFLTEFSPNIFSNVLGNGVPCSSTVSRYGKYVTALYKEDLFMEDIGLVGVFTMFGILAVVGYIMIWVKSFQLALPSEYYYVKYYLWFLLITCLTSDTVYSAYYLITTVFALYIYQSVYNKQKQKKEETDSPEVRPGFIKYRF